MIRFLLQVAFQVSENKDWANPGCLILVDLSTTEVIVAFTRQSCASIYVYEVSSGTTLYSSGIFYIEILLMLVV